MNILVFDDSAINRDSALRQLGAAHQLMLAENYDEAQQYLAEYQFDVALLDLMVYPSMQKLAPESANKYHQEEMPLGVILALYALSRGVKKVAVITDANHHAHPASAGFDIFAYGGARGIFNVGDAVVLLDNYNVTAYFDTVTHERVDGGRDWSDNGVFEGTYRAKDWQAALNALCSGA